MSKKIGDFSGKVIGLLLLLWIASCGAPKDTATMPDVVDEPPAITAEAVTRSAPEPETASEPEQEPEPDAAEAEAARLAAEEAERKAAEEEAARLAAEEKARQEEAARKAAEEEAAQKAAAEEAARKAAEEEAARKAAEQKARQEEAMRKAAEREAKASNFDTYDNTEQQNTTDRYVLNTSSKKIHSPSCRTVPKIAPQNYDTSNKSISELEADGYTVCGVCGAHR